MCEAFALNFDGRKLHHDNSPSHTSIPYPPDFSVFPRLEITLNSRHFDTLEVLETESQAVLNTLTEHDFQDKLKKKTPWSESASELYRPSDRRLSAK
jgi:hypothetical protein